MKSEMFWLYSLWAKELPSGICQSVITMFSGDEAPCVEFHKSELSLKRGTRIRAAPARYAGYADGPIGQNAKPHAD